MRFAALVLISVFASQATADIWINEIHYDNASTDEGEAVEVVVAPNMSSTAAADITITRYNGSNGSFYGQDNLSTADSFTDPNGYTFYTLTYPSNGLQNGAPDGLALSLSGTLIQFLSYEGSFEASDGDAFGVTSVDIGVEESSSTPVGFSLQLTGTGTTFSDFSWATAAAATFATSSATGLNNGQTLSAVPEPSSFLFLGLFGLALSGRSWIARRFS